MKKIVMTLMSLSCILYVGAQDAENMVENPSFEEIEGRIKRSGAITAAVGWMSPTKASADLFSGRVKEGFGTPLNNLGDEEAQDGENYAGIRVYSHNDKEPRNYISSKLKSPMKKEQKYCVTFYVNNAESSKYASNNIAINFSKKQYNISEAKSILTTTGNIMHKDNPVMNGQFGWDQICGVYSAEGGEKFVTIGNFMSNGETKNQPIKKSKTFTGPSIMSAYYFVDNVSVIAIDDESDCICRADEKTPETKFIYEVAPMATEGVDPSAIVNFTSIYFGYGDSELSKNGDGHMKNILKVMLDNPKAKIMVTSHLDVNEAKDPAQAGLSDKRSEVVKLYLMSNGISYTRILSEDKQSAMPADNADNDLAKAKNRRVTFTYIP